MKKKTVFILLFLFIIGISVTLITFRIKDFRNTQKIISEIENSYAEFVIATDSKILYQKVDNNYIKSGEIYPNTVLPLEEKAVTGKEDIYYQIKNTNYYIDYQNIKKADSYQEDHSFDHYVITNTIQTNPTNLYQDGQIMISLDQELEFDVLLKDNNQYYVQFLGDIYYIKDSYELKSKESVDTLKDISILNFSNDISNDKLTEVLAYLKENSYETISLIDFKRWVNGQVDLENNKVLLLSYKELDSEKSNIVNDYNDIINTNLDDISFSSGDTKVKVGDTKYYKYEIYSTTSIDRIKDMLNGIKEKVPSVSGVAVLNYHFFYDSSIGEACNESICLDVSNFRKQLDYLKNNGYKTLTMQEFNDWMDKKITLPEKSVLITIDDGAMGTSTINGNQLIPILEEYQMHATLFLITGWWDVHNYKSEYLEIHSHGDELHHNNYCRNGSCTYKGLLLSKDELKADLQISIDKIGSNLAFCYPFYAKNHTMVEALQETGFQLAFVGGNRKAKQTDDKYAVPRYVIYKNTSLESFIQMVK